MQPAAVEASRPCWALELSRRVEIGSWDQLLRVQSMAVAWPLHRAIKTWAKGCRFCGSGIGMSCNVAWSMFITARNQIGVRCALGCWLSIPSLLQLSRHSVGVCMHKLSTHGPCDQDLSQKTYVQLARKGYLVTSFPLRGETENVNSYASKPGGRMFFVPQFWFQLYGISHPCEKCLL